MKFEDLQSALVITDLSICADKLDSICADKLDDNFIRQIKKTNKVVVGGKSPLPLLAGSDVALDVEATFFSTNDEPIRATLRYKLSPDWKFSDSFVNLPVDFDPNLDDPEQRSVFDGLKLSEAHFYLTTHSYPHQDDIFDIDLQRGLNFAGKWNPTGLLGVFESLFGRNELILQGPIVFAAPEKFPPLVKDQFPWDVKQAVPGINLHASLGTNDNFGGKIKFPKTLFRIYSPVALEWLTKNPTYEPVMAYVNTIEIPSAGVKAIVTTPKWPGDHGIMIASTLTGVKVDDLAHALTDIAGADDSIVVIPESVEKTIKNIELRDFAVRLDPSDEGYEVTYTVFTIGMKSDRWSLFGRMLEIELDAVRILVAHPFDRMQRWISASISGKLNVFGVELNVTVVAPGFFIYAEQIGSRKVQFQAFFEKYHIPAPPDFEIDHIRLMVEPGFSYTFSMGIAAGHKSWKGEVEHGLRLPSAIDELSIDNLAVTYNAQSEDFTFTCEGKLPLIEKKPPLDAIVTIEIKHQSDGTSHKLFGGQLTIYPQENQPLHFQLNFESGEDSKLFLAAYNDPSGSEVKIDDLIGKIFDTHVHTGLTFTLKDALFAYQSKTESKPECTPESTSESKYLFGLDIEGGLNLSDLRLPDLPLVGQPFPADQTLKLAFQVLLPSEKFTTDDVNAINNLLTDGLSLPNKELDGIQLSTTLRLGDESKQVDLPIGLNQQPKEGENGLSEVSQLPTDGAKAETGHTAAQAASADGTQWIKIQKSFGPVHFERVGLKYQDGKISGLLDADFTVAGLTIGLDGLTVSSPLDHFEPTFDLHGLSIDYSNGPVEIGGSFLRMETGFAGLVVIRTETLTLSAIGSYASLNGHPSLFIYAVLDYPLGGPAFFFVTGLAAGFGYNRALTMPTIDQVARFPLVEKVIGDRSPAPLPTDRQAQQETLTNELNKLENYIPPSIGENFLGVGIRFTSFKTMDSFALLVVKFGQRFEIDLLGLSTLVAPVPVPGEEPVPPVAEVQLALRATFIPDEGFLGILAQLTPHSYVLSKACHLTGGFAFYSWFKDQPSGAVAGDFVVTMGGYHPQFHKPDYYPAVPRLSLTWQVNDNLSIKAQAYFALTGQALMAGGNLEANYHSGDVKAWFKAGADFLITWKPYHYDARLYVNMGVEVTVHFFGTHHLSFDAGADLHLWGPEFAGHAHVYVKVLMFKVTFDVDFGAGVSLPEPIDWDTFKASFLPHPEQVCSIGLQQGLVRQIKDETGEERWIVNPKEFSLVTNSLIPSTHASKEIKLENANTAIFINPMAVDSGFSSEQTITITHENGKLNENHFKLTPVLKAAPAGLWGKPITKTVSGKKYLDQPDVNGKRLIENTLAGFEIKPSKPPQEPGTSPWINPKDLRYEAEPLPDAYEWRDFKLTDLEGKDAWQKVDTILDTSVKAARKGLLTAFGFSDEMVEFGQPVKQYAID